MFYLKCSYRNIWKKSCYLYALFFFLFNICSARCLYELSICAVFKNEAPYLKEWIEFHRLMGVQHFYLCNHHSTDDYLTVLRPYIEQNIVELYKKRPGVRDNDNNPGFFTQQVQCKFYSKCLNRTRGISKWVAFIDTDEFLFPTKENSLLSVLKKYEDCAGIAVNWQMFGTSNVKKILPHQLLIETLTQSLPSDSPVNVHVKCIVRPKYVENYLHPHYANYQPNYFHVNTDREPFEGPFSPYIQVDVLRINHYWTRDEDYFHTIKIPRRQNWGSTKEEIIADCETWNVQSNTEILRFVPELKKRVFPTQE